MRSRLAVLYQDGHRLDRLDRKEEAGETWTEMVRLAPADSFHGAFARWKLGELEKPGKLGKLGKLDG